VLPLERSNLTVIGIELTHPWVRAMHDDVGPPSPLRVDALTVASSFALLNNGHNVVLELTFCRTVSHIGLCKLQTPYDQKESSSLILGFGLCMTMWCRSGANIFVGTVALIGLCIYSGSFAEKCVTSGEKNGKLTGVRR
jgi:hypothetical protein